MRSYHPRALTLLTALLIAVTALPVIAGQHTGHVTQDTTQATGNTDRLDVETGTDAASVLVPRVTIDYSRYVLPNGLTLIVHEDHSTPIVALTMWYHVGSKNEGPEQHGFAHLFEHLMFQGTAHWEGEYFKPFERAGATEMNGTTNTDRTAYYATVPKSALDMALWMESDRMAYLLEAIDKELLKEQVHVVLNEMRQGLNQPYGGVWRNIVTNTYPESHPYSWPVIGSPEDLKSATLEDVRKWFKTYYGPSNATLVLAGDIEPEKALEMVKHYFGGIPAGPPLEHQQRWVAKMEGEHRHLMRDRVPQARVYMVWNVPPGGSPAAVRLQLVAELLAGSKTSPLYQRLVYKQQIATSVSAGLVAREIGSQFIISATAKQGVPLSKVEAAIREELRQFIENGPGRAALKRSKTRLAASFLRRIDSVSGKARVLARGVVYHDNPAAYKKQLAVMRRADPEAVRRAAEKWLSGGVYVLSVKPFGKHHTIDTNVDRSALPKVGKMPDLDLPDTQHAVLPNGLEIVLAVRHETPIVQMAMVFNAGYAADPANMPGLASMTLAMLDEGTTHRSTLEISADLSALGATLSTRSTLDASIVSMSALSTLLDQSLALYADVIKNPTFPKRAFKRLKKQRLAAIAQEKATPISMAMRVIGPLLYGDEHAYGIPLTGSGTIDSVKAMTIEDLERFARRWLRPDNATLVIVGDTTMAEIKPLLKKHFGDWQAADAPIPDKQFPHVEPPDDIQIYLIDRPGAEQSTIVAGNVVPPRSSPRQIGMTLVNTILGGTFSSRLNMNLREQKHWSYGAWSVLMDARAQQPFFTYTAVQTNKTAPAMKAIRTEIIRMQSEHPPTAEEIALARASMIRSLPAANETSAELASTLVQSVIFNLPEDYYAHYIDRVQSLGTEELEAAADILLAPGHMTWVVIGDLDKIESTIRALNWGRVHVIQTSEIDAIDAINKKPKDNGMGRASLAKPPDSNQTPARGG